MTGIRGREREGQIWKTRTREKTKRGARDKEGREDKGRRSGEVRRDLREA